jgi:hypothetical protein
MTIPFRWPDGDGWGGIAPFDLSTLRRPSMPKKPTFPHLVYSAENKKLWVVLATDVDDAVKRVSMTIKDTDGDELSSVHLVPEDKPFEIVGLLDGSC